VIVVADDHDEVRHLLTRTLGEQGHATTAVATPAEARAAMATSDCELVICDACLPGEPPLELLRAARTAHPGLPFVVLSGSPKPGFAAALELGAYGYLTKPVEPEQVVIAVANAFIRARLEQENRAYRDRLEEMVRLRTAALAKALVDLRSREAQLRALADNAHDLIFRVGVDPVPWVEYVSPSVQRLLGYSQQEFLDDPTLLGRLLPGLGADGANTAFGGAVDVAVSRKDGTTVWLGLALSPLRDEKQRIVALEGIGRDMTQRRLTEQSSRDEATQQAAVAELGRRALSDLGLEAVLSQAVGIVGATLETEFASVLELVPGGRSFVLRAATGWPDDLIGTFTLPNAPDSHAGYAIAIGRPVVIGDFATETRLSRPRVLEEAGVMSGISVVIGDPAAPYGTLNAHSSAPRKYDDEDVRFLASVATVLAAAVDRHRTEETLRHRALHDPLTGLPNRTLLLDHLAQALDRSARQGTNVALLFLDVDHFKQVNDRFGHEIGDRLLHAIADRLRRRARRIDTVARLGGDEFAVVCEDSATTTDAVVATRRLAEAFLDPIEVPGLSAATTATLGTSAAATTTVSMGVAVARPGDDPASLLRHADLAMYDAKRAGRGRLEVWGEPAASVESRRTDAGS
jgi:diguanylate cyclase (GGDEF)-like protein